MAKSTLRTCEKGHQYSKSSDCPTCPICEAARKPLTGFLAGLGAPARRALEAAGIDSLHAVSTWSEKELLQLHGFGPSSIPKLKQVLEAAGLNFKQ